MIRFNQHNEVSGGTVELKPLPAHTPRAPDLPATTDGHDPLVMAAAREFLEQGQLPDGSKPSQTWLARAIGMTGAVVSSWLNGSYAGRADRITRLVADVLKTVKLRSITTGRIIYESPVTREVKGAFEQTITHNCVTVLIGEPGIGKSCGAELYMQHHPTAVHATLYSRSDGNEAGVCRVLMRAVDTTRFSTRHGETRAEFLRNHFKNAGRLLVFDNGEFLTLGGLRTIIFFNDATDSPICIIATPELMEKVARHNKLLTRISLNPKIPFDATESLALKQLMADCPEHANALLPLAVQVLEHKGALRALARQIRHARYLHDKAHGKMTIKQAFKAAHGELVRDYKLID